MMQLQARFPPKCLLRSLPMETNSRFFLKILLPVLVAAGLFLAAIFLMVVPNYRQNLMEGKRETIRELTNAAWSVLQKLDQIESEYFTEEMAKAEAALIIGDMRYGPQQKDYFWITDTVPVMVVHPYRPSLVGANLTDYRDNQGKNFFVEIVEIVKENGDGFIDYKWQWKDDSLTVVPKLSYVKAYQPWGWIVGTGIYIDDVNRQIASLTRKVVWTSILVSLLLATLIGYLTRRNYLADQERQRAQEKQRDTAERYKKLVESSTEGVFMMLDKEIVYVNPCLIGIFGYSQQDSEQRKNEFFKTIENFITAFARFRESEEPKASGQFTTEFEILKKDGATALVVVNTSEFELEGKPGIIFAVKDVSRQKNVVKELEVKIEKFRSIDNLQLSANLLLQPLSDHQLNAPRCEPHTPVNLAARLMARSKADLILVVDGAGRAIGLLTHSDISRRVVATGCDQATPVSEIMSSPVISISEEEMVMDAFALMLQHQVSYIVIRPADAAHPPSYISLLSLSELRRDTPEFIINDVRKTETIFEISDTLKRLPRLIGRLVETGTGAATAGKLISRVSDAVTNKIIDDAIGKLGPAPAPFVFLVLGSDGRREQTLATDQDNAIVYAPANSIDLEICSKYFIELGQFVCNSLHKAGYPLCKGGVMAMNPQWCMDINSWNNAIATWIKTPNPQELLKTSIFFDFRPVYGNAELAEKLQHLTLKELKGQDIYFFNLAKSIIGLRLPAMDSQSLKYEGFDIKIPVLMITAIGRFWALKNGISLRNTAERYFALESAEVITPAMREEFEQAFRYLTLLRLKNQLRQIDLAEAPGNWIMPQMISEMDAIMLKRINKTISDHLNRMAIDLRIN